MRASLDKYLSRYALHTEFPATQSKWDECVVIPAKDEALFLTGCLEALNEAAVSASRRVLAIVVVNQSEGDDFSILQSNRLVLKAFPEGLNFFSFHLTIFVTNQHFPKKEGVGRARKIGADLALHLWAEGRITATVLRTTDADARVPVQYFSHLDFSLANIYPFVHDIGRQDVPLILYEIFLRYYVLGLQFAGSPYAFHTLGSCIAFTPKAYTDVRGFPRREAGEDFYFLNKVAKLGCLSSVGSPIRILSRDSSRTPFGTGAAMSKIEKQLNDGQSFCLDNPQVFYHLKSWLAFAEAFCENPTQVNRDALDPSIKSVLEDLKAPSALATIAATRPLKKDRLNSFHGWFDGLKTLRFIHKIRDNAFKKLDYLTALSESSFIGIPLDGQPVEILESIRVREGIS